MRGPRREPRMHGLCATVHSTQLETRASLARLPSAHAPVHEVVWLFVGILVTLVATRPWARPDTPTPVAPGDTEPAESVIALPSQPINAPATATTAGGTTTATASPPSFASASPGHTTPPNGPRSLARSVADELANLVSGVEGSAHNLIEAAADNTQVPNAAAAFAVAVQRLRALHTKLLAFGHLRARDDETPTVAVASVATRLRAELQHLQLGLELRWDPPAHLPEIAVTPSVAHDALSFLCAAMLRAELGATRLTVSTELCFAARQPRLQFELALEWNAETAPHTAELLDDPTFTLDLEASNHLVTSHGGDLVIHHLPGRSVRALVRWPVVSPAATPTVAATDAPALPAAPVPEAVERRVLVQRPPGRGHRYGGALVLEADPAVRAMLAAELKATGRAVFACADGASARTFLQATPDRFELLFVDHPSRVGPDDPLTATIRDQAPNLKIFALAPGNEALAAWPNLRHIQKPFGVHELRAALASALAAG